MPVSKIEIKMMQTEIVIIITSAAIKGHGNITYGEECLRDDVEEVEQVKCRCLAWVHC